MATIRSIDQISRKYATVTPQRSADYQAGVENPKKDWKTATAAAEAAFEAGVQGAMSKKSFGKGVSAAGTEKWKRGAVSKGVTRWGPGVAVAEQDYRSGFAPYRDVIERTALPARFARRDPRNLERVAVIAKALAAAKDARTGKG
jgi:hypothetical protein